MTRGWERILPGVRWIYVRSSANHRSATGNGVSTPFWSFSTRGITDFVPRLSELQRFRRICSFGDGNVSSSGCGGSMHDPQQVSDRPVGLGFPHRVGQFRPGGSSFSSPGCRSCICMEGLPIRGRELVVPGWCWIHFRAPANHRSAGAVGVSTPGGAVPTRGIKVLFCSEMINAPTRGSADAGTSL